MERPYFNISFDDPRLSAEFVETAGSIRSAHSIVHISMNKALSATCRPTQTLKLFNPSHQGEIKKDKDEFTSSQIHTNNVHRHFHIQHEAQIRRLFQAGIEIVPDEICLRQDHTHLYRGSLTWRSGFYFNKRGFCDAVRFNQIKWSLPHVRYTWCAFGNEITFVPIVLDWTERRTIAWEDNWQTLPPSQYEEQPMVLQAAISKPKWQRMCEDCHRFAERSSDEPLWQLLSHMEDGPYQQKSGSVIFLWHGLFLFVHSLEYLGVKSWREGRMIKWC